MQLGAVVLYNTCVCGVQLEDAPHTTMRRLCLYLELFIRTDYRSLHISEIIFFDAIWQMRRSTQLGMFYCWLLFDARIRMRTMQASCI